MTAPKKQPEMVVDNTPINPNDWKLGTKRFSKTWRDDSNDKQGSAFYFVDQGLTSKFEGAEFETDDGSAIKIECKRQWFATDAQKADAPPCLQFNGGKAVYDILPEKMMVNCNKQYKGQPFLPVEIYNEKITQGFVVTDTTSASVVANA